MRYTSREMDKIRGVDELAIVRDLEVICVPPYPPKPPCNS